ncbi:MAG: radical SAM protein [Spirochaetaceae bacterium]|nr:radical SAM protein [Spirochaetaceae bacterium]
MLSPHIYGPIQSRRLGLSLGVNVLPADGKICTFDCAYCECGWNAQTHTKTPFPCATHILEQLEQSLTNIKRQGIPLQSITFSGNGEPTLHPTFNLIIKETLALRNNIVPNAQVTVLTNGTTLSDKQVQDAFASIDNPVIKIDSAIHTTAKLIDAPPKTYSIENQITLLKKLSMPFTLQTMFLKGHIQGQPIDTTSPDEVHAYIELVNMTKPTCVMLYTLDRPTPCTTIIKIEQAILENIARKIQTLNIDTIVAG